MTIRITFYSAIILIAVSACTSPRQSTTGPERNNSKQPAVVNKNPKFLDDISVTSESSESPVYADREKITKEKRKTSSSRHTEKEKASALQVKYAVLLNTEPKEVRSIRVYEYIDEWYGTRYCLGGNSKTCTDCSGFVQNFFFSIYGSNVPRTAKEQYSFATKISISKLKQGDLLFYNTRGGVSHVGIYLQNNKFVHASTTGGVMISDMSEAYYAKRFLGARRVDTEIETRER